MTRVLLIEDHHTFAQALRAVFELEDDLEVVAAVERAEEAGSVARAQRPDVVLVDLDLPSGSGHDAIRTVRQHHPPARFVVLTALRDRVELARAVEVGVAGLLHKSVEMPVLLDAVRQVAAGANLVPPGLAGELLAELAEVRRQGWHADAVRGSLSPREMEVLAGLAAGRSVADLAEALGISGDTVETHLKNARSKLGAGTRLEAVVEALRLGLVEPPGPLPGNG